MVVMRIDHILEKGSGLVNEDTLVIGETIFGVFDGATSLAETPEACKSTGGQLAAGIARDVFKGNHYPLPRLGRAANTAIRSNMIRRNVRYDQPDHCWSTSAAVVRLADPDQDPAGTLEWFQTGDSHILLIYEDNTHQALVSQPDHDYETLMLLRDQADKSRANPVLQKQLIRVRAGMNKTYGVLNGDPGAEAFMNCGTVSLEGVKTVLLFTDGLSIPRELPGREKDFSLLADLFVCLGLDGLKQRIRRMEKSDPHCHRFPRFKPHDDIAAVALHI